MTVEIPECVLAYGASALLLVLYGLCGSVVAGLCVRGTEFEPQDFYFVIPLWPAVVAFFVLYCVGVAAVTPFVWVAEKIGGRR